MEFSTKYYDHTSIHEKSWKLILSPKWENHILERHGPDSKIIGKTKFSTTKAIYDLLESTPYIEQIGSTNEYRGGDLAETYNITAKKINTNEFEIITMFTTAQKKVYNNIKK